MIFERNLLLLVFGLVITATAAFAQSDFRSGYYITNDNDTTHGLIDYRGDIRNSKSCVFKKDINSAPVEFDAGGIKAYRFGNSKYYVSKKFMQENNENLVFMEVLLDGVVDLLYFRDLTGNKYLLEDREGKLYELSNQTRHINSGGHQWANPSMRYVGVLKAVFADCPEIHPEVDKASLKHQSLINLTQKYHNCLPNGEESIVYQQEPSKAKARWAAVFGIGTTYLKFSDAFLFSKFSFSPQTMISAGILLNAPLQGMNEKLSIDLEAHLKKGTFLGSYEQRSAMGNVDYSADMNVMALNPAVLLKYTFPKGNVKPFLGAGLGADYYILKKETVLRERIHPNTTYVEQMDGTPLSDLMMGITFRTGVVFLSGNREMFINLRYDYFVSLEKQKLSESFPKATSPGFWFSLGFYL